MHRHCTLELCPSGKVIDFQYSDAIEIYSRLCLFSPWDCHSWLTTNAFCMHHLIVLQTAACPIDLIPF